MTDQVLMKRLNIFLWIAGVCGICMAVLKTVNRAYHLRFFYDEIINVDASYRFYTTGEYGSNFDPSVTSGIGSNWLSGLVFMSGGTLLISRVLTSLLVIAQVLMLVYLAAGRYTKDAALRMGSAVAVLLILLHFPYWFGYIQHLGELQGALFLGWAMLAIRRHPYLAFYLLGAAVWGCKLIYLVAAVPLGGAYILGMEGSLKDKVKLALTGTGFFLLPLVAWMGIILGKGGWPLFESWATFFFGFVGGHSGVTYDTGYHTLGERLRNMEWASYRLFDKAQILFWLLAPVAVGLTFLVRPAFWKNQRLLAWIFLAGVGVMTVYTYWYFWISKQMWARHVQPALYVGLGLVFVMILQSKLWAKSQGRGVRTIAMIGTVTFLVAWDALTYRKFTPIDPKIPSYAAQCRTLTAAECITP